MHSVVIDMGWSKTKAIAACLIIMNLSLAVYVTMGEHHGESIVQLNTALEFSYENNGASASARFDYAWESSSKPQISGSLGEGAASISWDNGLSVSSNPSSNQVCTLLYQYFSKASIIESTLEAFQDGSWVATITVQLYQNLNLVLGITGDNNTVETVSPTIDATLFPSALKDQLKALGLEWLDINLLATFTINWNFIKDVVYHFFNNIIQGVLWIKNQLEQIFLCRIEL